MRKPNPTAEDHLLSLFDECAVIRVSQSPLNRQRWLLTLACGQDVWLTQINRPRMQRYPCAKCAAATGEPMGKGTE
jgi:hypothetical protein